MFSAKTVGEQAGEDRYEHVAPKGGGPDQTQGCPISTEGLHERGDQGAEEPPLGKVEQHPDPAHNEKGHSFGFYDLGTHRASTISEWVRKVYCLRGTE